MFFSVHPIKHMILICPADDQVHFDPLIKMLSISLLWEVTLFPFSNIILGKNSKSEIINSIVPFYKVNMTAS